MIRRVVAEFVAALLGVGLAFVIAAQPAAAATTAPCDVFGHLEASPGHVTAVFTVAKTCAEVSVVSWLAPDAHAGLPQTLYDHKTESDVAPGDYRWTITAPPEGCFVQDDLALPGGYTIDFILGGDHQCESPPSTTTTSTSTSSTTSTTTTSVANPTTTIPTSTTASPPTTSSPTEVIGTPITPTEELAFSGSGHLVQITLGALLFLALGRYVEHRGKKRRAESSTSR